MGKEESKKELEEELSELRAEIADLDKRLEYDDPKQRKPRKGVRVVASKRPDNES